MPRRRTTWPLLAIALGLAPAAAALAAAGDLDPGFGGDGTVVEAAARAAAVGVTADGTVVSAGLDGGTVVIARHTTAGVLAGPIARADPVEGFPLDDAAVAVDGAGRVVVAGHDSGDLPVAARYLPDGTPDATFGAGGVKTDYARLPDEVEDVAVAADGSILVGGNTQATLGEFFGEVVRLQPGGAADAAFGPGGSATTDDVKGSPLAAVAPRPEGGAIVAGSLLVAFDAGGDEDPGFASGARSPRLADATVPEDGSVVTVTQGGAPARHAASGATDPGFTAPAPPDGLSAAAVAVDAAGRVIVAGAAGGDLVLRRHRADGSLDPGFGGGDGQVEVDFGGADRAAAVLPLPGGALLAAGASAGDALALARTLGDPPPAGTPTPDPDPEPTVTEEPQLELGPAQPPAGGEVKGVTTSSGPGTPRPRVKRGARLEAGRKLAVRIRCAGPGDCDGLKVKLRARARQPFTAATLRAVSIEADTTAEVVLTLSRRTRRLVRRPKGIRVTLVVTGGAEQMASPPFRLVARR